MLHNPNLEEGGEEEGGYRSSVLHSYRVNDALTCELFCTIFTPN